MVHTTSLLNFRQEQSSKKEFKDDASQNIVAVANLLSSLVSGGMVA